MHINLALGGKDINGSPISKIKCTVYAAFRAKNLNFLKSGENRNDL